MRTRLLNLLLVTALALATSRLWAFLQEPAPALPPVKTVAPPPAPPATVDAGEDDGGIQAEAFDAIVARDLFSPTRGVVPPAPPVAARPVPKPQAAPKLTLYGVVIVDSEKTAFLQEGSQEARPRKVRENESFAGGVIKSIRPDGVTFVFAGSEINVPLRTPKDTAAPPTTRGQDGAAVRPAAPTVQPRRPMPAGATQLQMPTPGRPVPMRPGMPTSPPGIPAILTPGAPTLIPPTDPAIEEFEGGEFPEDPAAGEEPAEYPGDEAGQ